MRRIKCYDCGKVYNFDVDDFCPRCGAFNQPPRALRVAADGTVERVDGLNETNHAGSFVHEELHKEDRARKRQGLEKGVSRTSPAGNGTAQPARPVQPSRTAKPAAAAKPEPELLPLTRKIIFAIIGFDILVNILKNAF